MGEIEPGQWKCEHTDNTITFVARMAEGKELSAERAIEIANLATDLLNVMFEERGVPVVFARQEVTWVDDGDDTVTVHFRLPQRSATHDTPVSRDQPTPPEPAQPRQQTSPPLVE